jgi:hypothetical protein
VAQFHYYKTFFDGPSDGQPLTNEFLPGMRNMNLLKKANYVMEKSFINICWFFSARKINTFVTQFVVVCYGSPSELT